MVMALPDPFFIANRPECSPAQMWWWPAREVEPLPPEHRFSSATKSIMAALSAWGAMDTSQIVRFSPTTPSRSGAALRALRRAGMVQTGRFVLYGTNAPHVHRIANTESYRRWMASLTTDEWFEVTGSMPPRTGARAPRHDLMVVDLALAIAAGLSDRFGVVLGESYASLSGLFPSYKGKQMADLVAVRDDGLRVVVELTATWTDGLPSKIRRWGQVLAANGGLRSGTVVVFLTAGKGRAADALQARIRRHMPAMLAADAIEQSGAWLSAAAVESVRSAVHLASWEEWVLGPLAPSPFLPTRFLSGEGKWVDESLVTLMPPVEMPKALLEPYRQRERLTGMPRSLRWLAN